MSRPLGNGSDTGASQSLGTTSARLIAVHIKSANKNIFRALLSLASANLIMRLMGMVGLLVTTSAFGQGTAMDAYNVASLVPITLAQMVASGLEASVIPVYARVRTRGKEKASQLFSTLLNLLIISLVVFTAIMLIFRVPLMYATGPGLIKTLGTLGLAINLTPFIFPVIIFMTLNSFMECLLNTEGKFGWPAYAGIAVPLSTAAVVLMWGQTFGVVMLCIGTMLGQMIQLAIIIYRARKAQIIYRPHLDIKSPEVKQILLVAWPALFSSLIQQLGPYVDTVFASTMAVGSIAAIANANKLTSVPVGVIFGSVGRAALPYLASQAAIKDMKAFKGTLRLYVWAIGIVTTLVAAGMIIFSHPLVFLLFRHGKLSADEANFTTEILIGNLIGLPAMAVGFLVARAFSALGKTRVLMWTTVFSVIANAIFDYTFGLFWGTFGITLATSIVYYCTMFILIFTLRAMIGKLDMLTPPPELPTLLAKFGLDKFIPSRGGGAAWRDTSMLPLGIPYATWKIITRALLITFGFAAAVAGITQSSTLTLAICFGLIVVLYLLRYQYTLLLCWVLVDAFVGSSLPLFNGAHLLSGLTVPTLLLLFYVPTKTAFQRMPALPLLLIFFLLMLPTARIAPLTMSEFVTQWSTLLDFIGVAVLTIVVVNTRQRMLRLIDCIMVPTVFIAFYGIYGYLIKQHGVLDTSTGFFRISSIFSDTPPTLAMFLTITIPLAVYRTFTLQGRKRLIGISIVALLLITLGLTFTRGALLAVPISIVVMILLIPSNRLRFGMLGGIVSLGAVLGLLGTLVNVPILSSVFSRFGNSDLGSFNGRTYLWQAIIDHYDPAQLLGYGHHASDNLLLTLKVGFGGGVIATAAHNIFLEALYDHGSVGLFFLVLTLLVMGGSILWRIRGATYEHRLVIAMAAAVFTGVLMQCVESNDIWNQGVGIYFMIIMALPYTLYWSAPKQAQLPVIKQDHFERETARLAAVRATTTQKHMAHV